MDLKNINFDDLKNIDFENINSWPSYFKVLIIFLSMVAVVFAGYYFDTSAQIDSLDKVKAKETELRKEFETKQAKASNLEAYKQQMKEMEDSFGTMLRQLPSKTEVADLLVDITQTGLASGLSFELFKPQQEIPRDFYAELPISLTIKGDYHQFGEFVSGVAALPRIVSLHDIKINATSDSLTLNATAKTYRYMDESEKVKGRRRR